jgi:phosphohistidine phosphatase
MPYFSAPKYPHMKTLYLVRHAKSSWEYELEDIDRPLKGRGVSDAQLMSQFLAEEGIEPDAIYSSPATRALHTAIIFSRNMGIRMAEIKIDERLYHISSRELLKWMKQLPENQDVIMVFGHNPGITDFLNKSIDHRIDNVPTTGVACLRYDVDMWTQIDKRAELVFFDYPKNRKNS